MQFQKSFCPPLSRSRSTCLCRVQPNLSKVKQTSAEHQTKSQISVSSCRFGSTSYIMAPALRVQSAAKLI